MGVVELLERAARTVWRLRFRIPPSVFWGSLFGGVIVAFFVSASALVWPLAVAALGAAGVWHWRGLQRRTTLLLVPRVETYGDEEQGRRVQDQVLNTLRRSLTTEEMSLVGPVATVVGPNDTAFALLPSACLRRGLGAPAVASRPLGRNPSSRPASKLGGLMPVGRNGVWLGPAEHCLTRK